MQFLYPNICYPLIEFMDVHFVAIKIWLYLVQKGGECMQFKE